MLEDDLAEAELDLESRRDTVIGLSLARSRVVRVLGLSKVETEAKDAAGNALTDPATGDAQMQPSPRETALASLHGDFPAASDHIDAVVTAHDDEGVRETAIRSGAVAFLRKPFDEQELLRAVSIAVGG